MSDPAVLLLADGTVFTGRAIGAIGRTRGNLVAYAGAFGFPDVMTDPSYLGKMICFTYPHVGNPGVGPDDFQSEMPMAAAAICHEVCPIKANRLGKWTFSEFLANYGIPGIDDIDTRSLSRIIYEKGCVAAALGSGSHADPDALAAWLREPADDTHSTREYATRTPHAWQNPNGGADGKAKWNVVVHDFGVKLGFLRRLTDMGCAVTLVPHDHPAADSLAGDVDGVVFSAGPGAPAAETKAIESAKAILGKKPLWGVGIGAGILALAAGAKIASDGACHYGEHGVGRSGEPLAEMAMLACDFSIAPDSLAPARLDVTHFHLNSQAVMGYKSDALGLMANLYHPESEPGPRDNLYLFERFGDLMRSRKGN